MATKQPTPPAPAKPKRTVLLSILSLIAIALLALTLAKTAIDLKQKSLEAYRYTSDIFTYDQILQETLKGHFGLEFTYGNQFGDHAYLALLLLLPVKALLTTHMIPFLMALGSAVYVLCGILLFLILRSSTGVLPAFLATLACLFIPGILQGLFEDTYGFHADTFAGFLIIVSAALLDARSRAMEQEQRTKAITIAFWIVYSLFLLMKEEFALLGVLFFFPVLALRRSRFNALALGVSALVFLGEMIFLHFNKTEWNRTSSRLVGLMLELGREQGFAAVFWRPEMRLLYGTLAAFTIAIGLLALLTRRINPYALGLLAMGYAKFAFSILINEPSLVTWHGFPAMTFLTGALILQTIEMLSRRDRLPAYIRYPAASLILIALLAVFFKTEVPFCKKMNDFLQPHLTGEGLRLREECLQQVKQAISRDKIVALHGFGAADWVDGYRYSFFPRGVFWPPRGVADYVLVDRLLPQPEMIEYLENAGSEEFRLEMQNTFFLLFKRQSLDAAFAPERERFSKRFHLDSLQATPPLPITRNTNRRGISPYPL